jgi:hypothetical protein
MPKRVIDFDAMWASDKLAACAEWAQTEYAWLYGLADCAGCFELTNLRVIWGRVSAIRRNFSLERLEQVFDEFHARGLLFIWTECGKRYGHWTGSDVPGRLPPPSWRNRLERLAPPVPREQLAEYVAAHSAGVRARASSGSFANMPIRGPAAGAPLQPRLEPAPAQGLDLDQEGKGEVETHTPVLESAGKVCEEPQRRSETAEQNAKTCLERTTPSEIGFCLPRSPSAGKLTLNESDESNSQRQIQNFQTPGFGETGLHEANVTALSDIWEQERGTLPELRALTPERVARCRERLSHSRDRARFLADFRVAVRRAAATPFLCGAGPAGWRANFDWVVANDTNYVKVLEGRYDAVARDVPTEGATNGAGIPSITAAQGNVFPNSGAPHSWSARSAEREEFTRRELRAGAGPVAALPSSMRIRSDVIERALKRE